MYLEDIGFLTAENGIWTLDPEGKRYVTDHSTETLLEIMCRRNVGLRSLLYVLSVGPMTVEQIGRQQLETHHELGWNPENPDMALKRVNWLRIPCVPEISTVPALTRSCVVSSVLKDQIVVLTGGTSGIGRIAARELAEQGATVAVIGRDQTCGERLTAESTSVPGEIRFHRTDLATQAAVRALAADIRETYDRIDALVHNAGLSVPTRTETADGIELTLAVNHLAPYLLTHELLDMVTAAAPSRVVVTASDVHRRATLNFDDLQFTADYDPLQAYARSKLATIAFTFELADRLSETSQVTANCFHPGFIPSTNLFRDASVWTRVMVRMAALIPGIGTTQQDGAQRLLQLVTDPQFGERSGTYVTEDGITSPSTEASDPATRKRLWGVSAELVGIDADWP
ncbi:SDR family NAD(P)-dependent oxidoreductase [Haloarchaeobius amylolyticus]|uniref:SDR family NAD(P)-dependent oxidoreductase n=1 Tax=Haloarchaeobius amylolyticus TaxID=1198296 RepID=A0ABD6BAY3_9EURY